VSSPIRIPADVDREDRVIGELTARQLAILAATAAVVYLAGTVASNSAHWSAVNSTPPVNTNQSSDCKANRITRH
jgi:hypothetical protein